MSKSCKKKTKLIKNYPSALNLSAEPQPLQKMNIRD